MAEITMAELFDGQSSKCAESAAPMSCVARHSPGARTSLPAVCTVDPLDSRGYPMPPFGTVVQRGLELKKDVWGLQQAIKRTNSDIMRRWAKTPSSDDPVHARRSSLPRFFESHDFPPGLCVQMRESLKLFPTRVWVLDNSSSMRDAGGKHYACSRTYNAVTKIRCSRWEELRNLARIHGQFAAASGATTTFHLLNPPSCGKQQIQVSDSTDLSDLREALHSQPEGHTPLTSTIRDITKTIRDNVAELLLNKKKVVVVIASDGLPTDTTGKSTVSSRADFRDALENLQRLPVWIVVRLLTDDATVVRFWNTVDQELEAPIEVLGDWETEAKEVYAHNPWLTYALPLHMAREFGIKHKLFDVLDERPLHALEVYEICRVLFFADGYDCDEVFDFPTFVEMLKDLLSTHKSVMNPIIGKLSSWIDFTKLRQLYSGSKACSLL